jgi:hypothetical protein
MKTIRSVPPRERARYGGREAPHTRPCKRVLRGGQNGTNRRASHERLDRARGWAQLGGAGKLTPPAQVVPLRPAFVQSHSCNQIYKTRSDDKSTVYRNGFDCRRHHVITRCMRERRPACVQPRARSVCATCQADSDVLIQNSPSTLNLPLQPLAIARLASIWGAGRMHRRKSKHVHRDVRQLFRALGGTRVR